MTPYPVHTDSALPLATEITRQFRKFRLSLHNRPVRSVIIFHIVF